MEEFYSELKERALRMRVEDFVAWVQGPVLLLDPPHGIEQQIITGTAAPEATVLFQDNAGDAGGDSITEAEGGRIARRLSSVTSGREPRISIGRSDECDIVLDHHSISKVHAYISRAADGSLEITDAESRNGVTINGKRISSASRIRGDDVIRIGAVMARLVYPKQLFALVLDRPVPSSKWKRLRDRTFASFWVGQVFASLADVLYRVAIVTWVMDNSGSGAALSAIGIFTIVALAFTLLFGGILVDRLPRARVLLLSLMLHGTVTSVIAYISLRGALHAWHLYVAAALLGVGDALSTPASGALVPEIVRKEDLPGANALNMIAIQGGNIVGPLFGAVLSGAGGHNAAFATVAVFWLISALCISRVPAVSPYSPSGSQHRIPQGTLKEAALFMLTDPWLWITSLVSGVCYGLSFAATLITLPILIKTSLHVDMSYYNVCISMSPAGAMIGSLWLAHRVHALRRGRFVYALVAGIGVCHFVGALPVTVYGVAAAWLVRGIATSLLGLTWVGTLQQLVPREMLGRVVSLDAFAQVTFILAGFLGYGWLAEHARPEPVFLFGGTLLMMLAVTAMMRRRIRTFE